MTPMTEYFVKMIEAGPSPERSVTAERNKRARAEALIDADNVDEVSAERIRIAGKIRDMFHGDFRDVVLRHCGLTDV